MRSLDRERGACIVSSFRLSKIGPSTEPKRAPRGCLHGKVGKRAVPSVARGNRCAEAAEAVIDANLHEMDVLIDVQRECLSQEVGEGD
jgi:hypothetical protein